MFGMSRKPLANYAQVEVETNVETASPHQLILTLFDGAISACRQAKIFMLDGNIPQKGSKLSQAINILTNGLNASLDLEAGGELAERLSALYDYMAERLLQANIQNNTAAIDEVIELMQGLRDAWAQISPNQQQPASSAA
jgi:flagellar protein FliS